MTLEERLGYTFRDPALLERALTHSSYAHEHRRDGVESNERLEFLGDAVLKICVAELLFERLPGMSEGELTTLLHKVVDARTLTSVGRELELGSEIKLGRGEQRERKATGEDKAKLLEDAAEAILGAIYLDGGLEACQGVVARWMNKRIDPLLREGRRDSRDAWKAPKTRLQELTERRYRARPEYVTVSQEGPPHAPDFVVEVRLDDRVLATATAGSKKKAEREAAIEALIVLEATSDEPEPAEPEETS